MNDNLFEIISCELSFFWGAKRLDLVHNHGLSIAQILTRKGTLFLFEHVFVGIDQSKLALSSKKTE